MNRPRHVEIRGAGPDLVLLHGWALHGGMWGPWLDGLAQVARLHVLDLPGHDPARPSAPGHVRLPMKRGEIADYLGLTIETVSRQFTALRKDGVIILEGQRHVQVPNLADLLTEAGDDSDGGLPV
jgi:pimeloyl-ACP methyl ester carboxylesterase